MKILFELIIREFKFFAKHRMLIAIFLGAPILYSVLIGNVYKDASVFDLPILVVDLDDTPFSRKIIDALDDNQYLAVKEIKHETGSLKNDVIMKGYTAVITIPDRFEADIQQKRYPEIDADVNAANMLTANFASTGIQTVLAVINAGTEIETIKKKGVPQAIAEQQYESFKISVTRHFNPSSNYLLFMWPGMLGVIMQQVFLMVMALTFASEFENNTFKALVDKGKSVWRILLAKSIPYWIIGMILWFPLIYISFPYFRVSLFEHQMVFWAISTLFIICLTFMGIAVSILFNNQLTATEILMIIASPSFIISGHTWPLQQMPEWIQVIAKCIPLTHYIEAFRRIVLMDAGFNEVIPMFRNLAIMSLIFLIAALVTLNIRKKLALGSKLLIEKVFKFISE